MTNALPRPGITHRLVHEMKQYAVVTLYLYICLGALQLYKGALLRAEGVNYLPYGIAAIKALILGKFMMVGHALRIGQGYQGRPLIYPILHKSLGFLTLLFILNLLEEVAVDLIHGRPVAEALAKVAGGTLLETVAVCVLFFLILLPYFAYREVGEALGEGALWRMLFSRSARQQDEPLP